MPAKLNQDTSASVDSVAAARFAYHSSNPSIDFRTFQCQISVSCVNMRSDRAKAQGSLNIIRRMLPETTLKNCHHESKTLPNHRGILVQATAGIPVGMSTREGLGLELSSISGGL